MEENRKRSSKFHLFWDSFQLIVGPKTAKIWWKFLWKKIGATICPPNGFFTRQLFDPKRPLKIQKWPNTTGRVFHLRKLLPPWPTLGYFGAQENCQNSPFPQKRKKPLKVICQTAANKNHFSKLFTFFWPHWVFSEIKQMNHRKSMSNKEKMTTNSRKWSQMQTKSKGMMSSKVCNFPNLRAKND